MEKLSHMVSMECEPPEPIEAASEGLSAPAMPIYPYGLAISLTQDELEKLDVDYSEWGVGDLFHLHAMAKITSISESESTDGKRCRVEMQIIALAGEDEDSENQAYEDAEENEPKFRPLG